MLIRVTSQENGSYIAAEENGCDLDGPEGVGDTIGEALRSLADELDAA